MWGVRWIGEIGEIGDADLDPKLLLWDMHRHVDHGPCRPDEVVAFRFPDAEQGAATGGRPAARAGRVAPRPAPLVHPVVVRGVPRPRVVEAAIPRSQALR